MWIKQLFIYMEKVVMLKKLFITIPLFSNCDVIGLDYTAQFPWEAKEEFPLLFNSIYRNYKTVEVIANSIGAYFAINALSNQQIEKAYFISPVVDMERLIADMMIWANCYRG